MNDICYAGQHPLAHDIPAQENNSWEFIYCTSGCGAVHFMDQSLDFNVQSVLVVPPRLSHSFSSESGFQCLYVQIDAPTFLSEGPVVIPDNGNGFLLNAFTAAYHHYHSTISERLALLAAYGNLICCYLAAYRAEKPRRNVVKEIERDILAHYADCDYRLDAFLRSLPFSYDYIRKLFQHETGQTPHKYLNDLRLQASVNALVNGYGASIADISRMCGFREPLYFSRMFKKRYGVAPSSYVERMSDKQAPSTSPEIPTN